MLPSTSNKAEGTDTKIVQGYICDNVTATAVLCRTKERKVIVEGHGKRNERKRKSGKEGGGV